MWVFINPKLDFHTNWHVNNRLYISFILHWFYENWTKYTNQWFYRMSIITTPLRLEFVDLVLVSSMVTLNKGDT